MKNKFMLTERELRLSDALAMNFYQKHRLNGYGVDFDDVKGVSYLALTEASLHYNPQKGVKFTTYAYTCILNALNKFLDKTIKNALTIEKFKETSTNNYELNDYEDAITDSIEDELIDYIVRMSVKKYKKESKRQLKRLCKMMMEGIPPMEMSEKTGMDVKRIRSLTQRFRNSANEHRDVIIDNFF